MASMGSCNFEGPFWWLATEVSHLIIYGVQALDRFSRSRIHTFFFQLKGKNLSFACPHLRQFKDGFPMVCSDHHSHTSVTLQ